MPFAIVGDKQAHDDRERVRVLNAIRQSMEPIAEYPFLFASQSETKPAVTALGMDGNGERLRFLEFNLKGEKTVDRIVPISTVLSVELSGGDEVVNDYATTSTKPNALSNAIVGGLIFGSAGAIVGATSAGSKETTVATQRLVKRPTVLVFELSDLANPVMRFSSTDHEQCDLWLHRVRSAMARHAKASGGSKKIVANDRGAAGDPVR